MTTGIEDVVGVVLPPLELCDRCGVRARVHVLLDTGGELFFCAHHAGEHRDALKQAAFTVEFVPD